MSAELQIQGAVITALKANGTLTAMLATTTSIYDNVPEVADSGDSSAFPYVVIGDDTSIPFDADDTDGFEATITVHTWSRTATHKQAKQIIGSIYDSLHKTELVVTGYNTVLVLYEFSTTEKDPDGITIHGIQRFRIIITEE